QTKTKAKSTAQTKTKAKSTAQTKTKAKSTAQTKTKAKSTAQTKTKATDKPITTRKPKNAAKPKTTIVLKPKIDPRILPNPKRNRTVPSIGKPLTPDKKLAAIIGKNALLREKVNELIWNYINERGLRDPQNKRMINADEKLKEVFDGKKQVTQFELNDLINKRLKK
ncbi:MAG: SWIB/MDM2 domain-containing protein, partial [Candidatus Latescibacterota bacterium]|nr:SWIB/MDM2 domain-containing protein [Candidatus Latescibacterota bacterium]